MELVGIAEEPRGAAKLKWIGLQWKSLNAPILRAPMVLIMIKIINKYTIIYPFFLLCHLEVLVKSMNKLWTRIDTSMIQPYQSMMQPYQSLTIPHVYLKALLP